MHTLNRINLDIIEHPYSKYAINILHIQVMSSSLLFQPLQLPNGAILPNRIARAAMDSALADANHAPGSRQIRLYQRWADGGAGLIITGSVMIDRHALSSPGSTLLDSAAHLPQFGKWANACRSRGAQVWMQLGHPGRQLLAGMGSACAPSAIPLLLPETGMAFAPPRAMTEADILDVIQRFADSARLAERAGFDGVQIDAGHGHLLSQFLSPLSNQRQDQWGGNLANRARLLLQSVQAVRRQVQPGFCVSVKLNCSDFMAGGFTLNDAGEVIRLLNGQGVDLLEITGGTYASPAMFGLPADDSALPAEAYFLPQAQALLAFADMPLQLTGGIRSAAAATAALHGGMAMVGLATALAQQPELPSRWRAGEQWHEEHPAPANNGLQPSAVALLMQTTERLGQLAAGRQPPAAISPQLAILSSQIRLRNLSGRYRQWLARQEAGGPHQAQRNS